MLKSFNPVNYSLEENEFILAHVGEASVVALRSIKGVINPKAHPKDKNPVIYPEGVIPASVKPVLDGVIELLELEKHEGLKWAGLEAIKSAVSVYLREVRKWQTDAKRRGGLHWPSRYSFDAKGRGHLGGPGSDSGTIKTYFGPSGERLPFEIDLIPQEAEWRGPGFTEEPTSAGLRVDAETNRIECLVATQDGKCGFTESYKPGSRSSYNAARARMSKHLRKATDAVEAHRELHTLEFGQ